MAQYRKVRLLFTRSEMCLVRLDVYHNKRWNSLTLVQKGGDRWGWIVQDDDVGDSDSDPPFSGSPFWYWFFFLKPPNIILVWGDNGGGASWRRTRRVDVRTKNNFLERNERQQRCTEEVCQSCRRCCYCCGTNEAVVKHRSEGKRRCDC